MPVLKRMLMVPTEEFFQPYLFGLGPTMRVEPPPLPPEARTLPEPIAPAPKPAKLPEADDDALFESLLDTPIELDPIPKVVPIRVPLPVLRPRNRTECAGVPRPCPFVSCRYNLYLDVRTDGVLRLNFPDREPHEMIASCALDLASDGPRTLDAIAGLMGMSKERARQLEASGLEQVKARFTPEDVD